ncbi:Thermitase [Chlorella vulgaris]
MLSGIRSAPMGGADVPAAGGAAVPAGSARCWQPPLHRKAHYAPGQVLVRFKQTPGAARTAVAQARDPVLAGLRLHRLVGKHHTIVLPHQQQGSSGRTLAQAAGPAPNLPSDALMLYDIEDGSSVKEMVARLCQHPGASATYQPRHTIDDRCSLLKPQRTPIFVLLLHCDCSNPRAAGKPKLCPSIKVCIVDSGILSFHQDLQDNWAGGWNRMPRGQFMPVPGTADYTNLSDVTGHGTGVSGIIGAVGNNGLGTVGVNWQVSLFMCKVGDTAGNWPMSSIIDCYSLCQREGVSVISGSFSALDNSGPAQQAILALKNAGILLVTAAGNSGKDCDVEPRYPAALSNNPTFNNVIGGKLRAQQTVLFYQVAVAGSNAVDGLWSSSNYGKTTITLAAPAIYIVTTSNANASAYQLFSGTSAATPIVAGAIALMYAVKPGASYQQIRTALIAGVDMTPELNNKVVTNGRLNVAKAITKLLGQADPTPYQSPCCISKNDTYFSMDITVESRWLILNTTLFPDPQYGKQCKAVCAATAWCQYYISTSDAYEQLFNPQTFEIVRGNPL